MSTPDHLTYLSPNRDQRRVDYSARQFIFASLEGCRGLASSPGWSNGIRMGEPPMVSYSARTGRRAGDRCLTPHSPKSRIAGVV